VSQTDGWGRCMVGLRKGACMLALRTTPCSFSTWCNRGMLEDKLCAQWCVC
jgi:hypothetical protein